MEAIILAGGFGSRLRKVIPDRPKPMAPIGSRPFLELLLGLLVQKGFSRIVLSLGFMPEKISSHFGTQFRGIDIVYVVEDTPLGTGGASRMALKACTQDHVFVFNGDTYINLDVAQLEQQWQENRCPIVVARYVNDTERYGRLVLNRSRITSFAEKGVSGPGLINVGCYVLPSGFPRTQLSQSKRTTLHWKL